HVQMVVAPLSISSNEQGAAQPSSASSTLTEGSQTQPRFSRPAPPPVTDRKQTYISLFSVQDNQEYVSYRSRARFEPRDDEGELPPGYSNPHDFAAPRFAGDEENTLNR
ncbi:MAG: hypothetical protein ACKPKO_33880, partial [Candidatus Fonsibacter sp.]